MNYEVSLRTKAKSLMCIRLSVPYWLGDAIITIHVEFQGVTQV